MKWYTADLHIHSVLSPCGSLEMSPQSIVKKAKEMNIDIIAVTDHNTMKNTKVYKDAAEKSGLSAFYGIEIQSAEEIHFIGLFDNWEKAQEFDEELYKSLLPIDNDPEFFGDQIVIDENEEIIEMMERALINSSLWDVTTVVNKVNQYGGLVFPAHVDAGTYSLISQLGFIPDDLNISACGITAKCDSDKLLEKFNYLEKYSLIRNSDAHYLKDIGSGTTKFLLEKPSLENLKKAINSKNKIKIN